MISTSWHELRGRVPKNFFLMLFVTIALSSILFTCLHLYDNKLNKKSPQAKDGMLVVNTEDIKKHSRIYLVDGWELYKDVILTPEDVGDAVPDEYISIGQYEDMSFGDPERSPHGSASYRLLIDVKAHEGDNIYTLQIPEIYSAYNLYINGELMQSMGNPNPEDYEPLIVTNELNFKAQEQVDILIAVSDWSHYNSGLIDPPAFGDTLSVNTMVQGRLIWRSAILGASIMLAVVVALGRGVLRRTYGILFPLLVLCFQGFTSYVIIHALTPSGMFWFWVQTFCYYAMFFLAIWLLGEICKVHTRMSMAVKIIDAAMCVLAIGVPIMFAGHYKPMHIFNNVAHSYKLFLLVYLTVVSISGTLKGAKYAHVIVCGMSVFITSTVINLIMPKHLPIFFGETVEISCFIMTCLIGSALAHASMTRYKKARIWRDEHYELIYSQYTRKSDLAEAEKPS